MSDFTHKKENPSTKKSITPSVDQSFKTSHNQEYHHVQLSENAGRLDHRQILQLQKIIGNQANQRLIAHSPINDLSKDQNDRILSRFEAKEHQRLGDDATRDSQGKTQKVQLADDYSLNYGDIVALAGDHFRDIDQMRQFAKKKGKGPGTRGEIEYLVWTKLRNYHPKEKTWNKAAEKAADARYYELALNNRSHFVSPEDRDKNRSTADKTGDVKDKFDVEVTADGNVTTKKLENVPLNAVGGYSHNHRRAIDEAYKSGAGGQGVEKALATEAFGAHYLTDAFASGHLRVPRQSVKDWWHSRVPMFNFNLKGYIAEKLSEKIEKTKLGGIITEEAAYKGALGQEGAFSIVSKKLDEKGFLTFGDVVSGALHDYDNLKGIHAQIDGHKQPVRLQGDGVLGKERQIRKNQDGSVVEEWVDKPGKDQQEKAIEEAVRAGKDDIVKVWEGAKEGKSKESIISQLTGSDGLYKAQRMIPKPDLSGQPQWKFPDTEGLLNHKKFQEGLKIFIDEKNSEFKKMAKTLPADQRKAFESAIIEKLEKNPVSIMRDVINWVPDTGGGIFGHNQDDNAVEYYKQAKKAGGLGSLTLEQRRKLIIALFEGATIGEDETIAWNILTITTDDEARELIAKIGWSRCEDEFGKKFSKRYPKSKYATSPAPTK